MRPKCKCEQDPLNRPLGKNQLYKIQSNFLHCNWSALQYTKEHRYVKTKSRCSWYLEESKVSPRSTKGLWAWSLSAPFLCSLLVQGKSSETTMLLQVSLPEGYISIPWFFSWATLLVQTVWLTRKQHSNSVTYVSDAQRLGGIVQDYASTPEFLLQ